MPELRKRRARAEVDKQHRRRDILAAAARVFAARPYAAVTIASVAQAAHLAKGTVYLYFPTKEALFLQLVVEALAEWFADLAQILETTRTPLQPAALADILTDTLAARPVLTRLLVLLHPVLEQNIDVELALAFKRHLMTETSVAAAVLEQRCDVLGPGEGVRFLLRLHAVVIGLHAMASPSATVAEVLARPDMAGLRIDFAAELRAVITGLLRGWVRADATETA